MRLLLLLVMSLFLISCAQSTIYPEANGVYSSVTTSSDQGTAENSALAKAADYCKKMGKSLVVDSHETAYHGPDKATAAAINLASEVLANPNEAHQSPATSSSDYEVTMKFRCN